MEMQVQKLAHEKIWKSSVEGKEKVDEREASSTY